jgi:hypothetical protein
LISSLKPGGGWIRPKFSGCEGSTYRRSKILDACGLRDKACHVDDMPKIKVGKRLGWNPA